MQLFEKKKTTFLLIAALSLLKCSLQQKELSMRVQQAKGRRSGCFSQLPTGRLSFKRVEKKSCAGCGFVHLCALDDLM